MGISLWRGGIIHSISMSYLSSRLSGEAVTSVHSINLNAIVRCSNAEIAVELTTV